MNIHFSNPGRAVGRAAPPLAQLWPLVFPAMISQPLPFQKSFWQHSSEQGAVFQECVTDPSRLLSPRHAQGALTAVNWSIFTSLNELYGCVLAGNTAPSGIEETEPKILK